jgi:hypothetical protein
LQLKRSALSKLPAYCAMALLNQLFAPLPPQSHSRAHYIRRRYAGKELLHFWAPLGSDRIETKTPYAKAIIDSGTSCLVLPNSWSPILKRSPCELRYVSCPCFLYMFSVSFPFCIHLCRCAWCDAALQGRSGRALSAPLLTNPLSAPILNSI